MKCFGIGEKKKTLHCKIILLDETELIQEIQDTFLGHDILDVVFKHLNLLETAYFGLRYINSHQQPCWLDANKNVVKQMKGVNPITLYFGVKFYASDPCKLLEEITRYQFFLQLKQDILQLRLSVSAELSAELLSYAVQSELGDYDPRHHESGYISEFRLLPNQTPAFEKKVEELHKDLVGQVPATAEMNFLERVKWLDLYGADLHPVLGEDNVEYFLGIAPSGVIVLRNKTKIGNYFWPRITKTFRKGKYFMLRVVDKANEENTYGFELPNKAACKHLLKCCRDHQEFFKLTQSSLNNKFNFAQRMRRSSQRSSFDKRHYIEQTQNLSLRPAPSVVRVPSRRYQRRMGQPDGADAGSINKEEAFKENGYIEVKSSILKSSLDRHNSSPQLFGPQNNSLNAHSLGDLRNNHLNDRYFNDDRGLFSNATNQSPRSVRSTSILHSNFHRVPSFESTHSRRNSSSSRHRSSRQSDNESEVSRCSRSSRHSRHSRCRHRKSGEESGTESDSSRKRHRRRHKSCGSKHDYKLVDSEVQWKEAQRKEESFFAASQSLPRPAAQSAVVRHVSGYVNSGMESDTPEVMINKTKRRNRSRSKSPEAMRKDRINGELKKHIEYQLVDPSQLSEREKRDIKYTKVETDSRLFKIRYSPSVGRHRYRLSEDRNPSHKEYNEKLNAPNYRLNNNNNNHIMKRPFQNGRESNTSISSVSTSSKLGEHENSPYNGQYQFGQNRLKGANRLAPGLLNDSHNDSIGPNYYEHSMNGYNYRNNNEAQYEHRTAKLNSNRSPSPVTTPRVKFQTQPDFYSEADRRNDNFGEGFYQHEMSTEL